MANPHFLRANQAFLYVLCGLLVPGCDGASQPKPAAKPSTGAAKAWKLPAEPWVPPTVEDVPADVDPKVRSLIEKTFSEKWPERADAANELGRLGDSAVPAIPFLIRLLGDPQSGTSKRYSPGAEASTALGALGKAAVPYLIAALGADKPEIRTEAVFKLRLLFGQDPRVVEPIIRALNDPNAYVRQGAASAVEIMRENRAVEPLIGLLHDPYESVAGHAARALGRIKDTRAVEPLIAVVEDRNRGKHLRASAAWALGLLGDVRACEPLLARCNDAGESPEVRADAAYSLAELKDPRAFGVLKHLLRMKDLGASRKAIYGFGRLGDDQSVRLLIELLQTTGGEVGEVAFALLWTDKPAAIDALIAAPDVLTRKDSSGALLGQDVFVQKIDALSLSANPRAYLWAVDALGRKDEVVRRWVLRAIAEGDCYGDIWTGAMNTGPGRRSPALKDPRIIDPLIAIVKDPKADESMRANAITALRKTEDRRAIKFLDSVEGKKTRTPETDSDN